MTAFARPRVQGGFMLLEALVALLIFALGVLGLIGFQAASARIATDSRFRTEAAMLADELVGQMAMSKVTTLDSEYGTGGSKLASWKTDRLVGGSHLPNGTISVSFTAAKTADSRLATITITWDMPGNGVSSNGDARTSSTRSSNDPEHGVYTTQALLF